MDGDSSETPSKAPADTQPRNRNARSASFQREVRAVFENLLDDSPTNPRPATTISHQQNTVPFFSANSLDHQVPQASPMQNTSNVTFCVEDTVGLKDDKFTVGVVDRSFGDIDSHEPRPQRDYHEEIEKHSDVPQDEFDKFMKSGIPPRGTALVSWQTEVKTELVPEARLVLLDRALYVGDVVKKTADEHMSGTVIGTSAVCTLFPTLHYHAGHMTPTMSEDLSIRNVPAAELTNVHEFARGTVFVYGDWVGRVETVYSDVAIKLSNNSVVVVENPDELEQDDATLDRPSVGDTVRTKKGNLRRGRWKYGAFDPHIRPEGVVVETRTVEIDVQWLARSIPAHTVALAAPEPPTTLGRDELDSSNLYRYDASGCVAETLPLAANGKDRAFLVADVAVGDRVIFQDLAGAAVKYDGTRTLPNGYPQGKLTRIPRTDSLGYDLNVFLVMQTHTKVTVQWQDLSVTEDLSISFIVNPNIDDDTEVWPGEVVASRDGRDPTSSDEVWTTKPAKLGVVQAVKSRDRIAQVRWFKNPSIEFIGSTLLPGATTGELEEQSEEVSLYDIYSSPAVTRRRNDFVLIHPSAIENLPEIRDVTGPNWFGEVVELGLDGKLTVRLGAAKPIIDVKVPYEGVTLAYSSEMDNEPFNHDPFMDESEEEVDLSDFDSASFNEMWIEYQGMDGEHPVGDEEDWSTEDEEESEDDDDDISMPDLEEIDDPSVETSGTTPEIKSPVPREEEPMAPAPDTSEDSPPIPQEVVEPLTEAPAAFAILDTFPPVDHHYIRDPPIASPALMRRIAKEHKILSSSLPPNIFVRTWEARLDLIRVLIIGPNDTPYEDAPFVIDFHLHSDFPHSAPDAYFHSWTNGGGPVNPNLYEDGKICLSLLGTWHTDERNESWSPAKSTLLQILVSIMGLVLVKEPYYNEAGYDVHRAAPETKLSSALYTERAFFRARGFIHHALTNNVIPFQRELEYLYHSKIEGAPRLLDKAVEAARAVVERSADGTDEGERDGLRTVSLGAVVMLKRQVEKLENLRRT